MESSASCEITLETAESRRTRSSKRLRFPQINRMLIKSIGLTRIRSQDLKLTCQGVFRNSSKKTACSSSNVCFGTLSSLKIVKSVSEFPTKNQSPALPNVRIATCSEQPLRFHARSEWSKKEDRRSFASFLPAFLSCNSCICSIRWFPFEPRFFLIVLRVWQFNFPQMFQLLRPLKSGC